MPRHSAVLLLASLAVSAPLAPRAAGVEAPSPLAALDEAWKGRAEGASGGTADAGVAAKLVALGREAVSSDPAALAPRWRLMRALYFQGEHATAGDAAKKTVF